MKKSICIIAILCLLAGLLTGCSGDKQDSEKIRVGIDLKYYPFMYLDDDGEPAGFEVDISKAFGEYLGKDVEIVNTDFTMLIPALETGDVDIVISDMAFNEERKEKVDFSEPYRYGRTLALVNKDFATANGITDEMSEKEFFEIPQARFIGLAGTISVTVPQSFGKEVTEVTENTSAIMEVVNGTADVFVGANTIRGDHSANPNQTIIFDGFSKYSSSCFAVKKGNEELLKQANAFIKSMYEEGGFYEKAGTKYDAAIGEFMHDTSLKLDYIIYPPSEE